MGCALFQFESCKLLLGTRCDKAMEYQQFTKTLRYYVDTREDTTLHYAVSFKCGDIAALHSAERDVRRL